MKQALIGALALAVAGTAFAAPLRDPFARPAAPPAAAAAADGVEVAPAAPPRLRAIMYEPGHSLANIGGQILATGQWFGDYRLIQIQERSVTLLRQKAKTVLVLDNEGSK